MPKILKFNAVAQCIGAVLALTIAAHVFAANTFGENMTTEEAEVRARKLYRLLNDGLPLFRDNPLYQQIVDAIKMGSPETAANLIVDPKRGSPSFYNNAIASLPQTINRSGTPVGVGGLLSSSGAYTMMPANNRFELSAMFVGYAKDGLKFNELFWADRVYFDDSIATNAVRYQTNPDAHFQFIWTNMNPRDSLKANPRPTVPGVGIFTTSQWGNAFYDAGTSRRNVMGLFEHFFCTKQDRLRSTVIPDSWVARDVPRLPGGDPNLYLKNCKSCHAQMDAIRPAFLPYTWNGTAVTPVPFSAANYDRINETNYPSHKPLTDDWNLFVSNDQNAILGFKDVDGLAFQSYGPDVKMMAGKGLVQLGKVIGNAYGVYRCMVRRIVSQVYLGKLFGLTTLTEAEIALLDSQTAVIERFSQEFASHQDLRRAYRDVALYYYEAIEE